MRAIVFPLLLVFSPTASILACEEGTPCEKCAKESEFSWNPANKYVTPRLERFYSLDEKIQSAYNDRKDAELKSLAGEYLALASTYRCNWNYGNAVHDANRYRGLASLRNGKVDEAADFLVLSGKSTGSPQLDTFGPDLDLANQLLKIGRVEPVKQYLRDVKTFWKMDNGQLDLWLSAIDRGETPELDRMQAAVRPSVRLIVLGFLILACPAIAALMFMYLGRRRLARKWLFLIVGVVSAYLSMVLINAGMSYLVPTLATKIESTDKLLLFSIVYMPVILTVAIPLLVVFLVFRYFSSKS